MRTIWPVAYSLTNGTYCAIEYIFKKKKNKTKKKQENSFVLKILKPSIALVIYL